MNKTLAGILDPLKAYAQAASTDMPPELLPWKSDDTWAMDGAARRALGLIVAGEQPGKLLFAMADYLLAFYTAGDWSQQFPDAVLLNGTALAVTVHN